MTTRKRNEFLDPVLSDDDEASEDAGYDSEAAEESKGRVVKRRRREPEADESGSEGQSDEDEDDEEKTKPTKSTKEKDTSPDDSEHHQQPSTDKKPKPKPKPTVKPTKKTKTGVIYLSSLPPYLKPSALKTLLSQRGFGPITRVFLTPYTPPPSAPRKRSNKRKSYTDGWVEFASKRTAKICAQTLNATIVGGKKGGWYHDDVWNMKYLKGFKWADLMEQVQRERSEREAKRRIEDSRARKEDKLFLEGVERGRVVEGIKRKNVEKGRDKAGGGGQGGEELKRVFKQNEVKENTDGGDVDEGAKRVLGKIF